MLLKIKLENAQNGPIVLPIDYNHIVQGCIYESIDQDLSKFLHDEGYKHHARSFKMFTFSRLLGEYRLDKKNGKIHFNGPVELWIASPVEGFFNALSQTFLIGKTIRLGTNNLRLTSLEGGAVNLTTDSPIVETLSPIVVYSTFLRPDNRKYTCYFQPGDTDYNRLITENLQKKYQSFYQQAPPEGLITVKPLSNCRQVTVTYKNIIIKGYTGKLKLSGPSDLIKIGLEGGYGSKNAQGFGLIRVLER